MKLTKIFREKFTDYTSKFCNLAFTLTISGEERRNPKGIGLLEEFTRLNESPHYNDEKALEMMKRDIQNILEISEMSRAHKKIFAGMKVEIPIIPTPDDEDE